MNLSADQLRRRVEQLLQPGSVEGIVGFAATAAWDGPDSLESHGQQIPVRYCRSTLEVAEQLAEADGPLVILTQVPERELPTDVLARLSKQRLQRIDRTELIRDAYGVNSLDPRIPRSDTMMNALLRSAPVGIPERMKPVLSLDDAWQAVLRSNLGLDVAPLTLEAVLDWSTGPESTARLEAVPDELRSLLLTYLEASLAAVGVPVVSALREGHANLLMPIGLVGELLVVADETAERATQTQAMTRLERYLGDVVLDTEQAGAWCRGAKAVLATLDSALTRQTCHQAEELIESLKAQSLLHRSSVLPSGFAARKLRFAQSLNGWLEGRMNSAEVLQANECVCKHQLALDEKYAPVCNRLQMAMRLVSFLEGGMVAAPTSLAEACTQHARNLAFTDWARRLLAGGDDDATLATALDQLSGRVFEVREAFNRQFAEKLADALETDSFHGLVLPIERFINCIGETASEQPVLLLVLDGLDCSAFEELAEDLRDHGWSRWQRPEYDALLSTVPSVTDMSRKALLTGDLKPGASAIEKRQFEGHPLLRVGPSNSPGPRLFHKAELEDSAAEGLSTVVREALRDAARRVVGVVLNAVDDHLAKTDQLRLNWTIEQFRHLDALLNEARQAGRVVIITSDHGHVLESSSVAIASGTKGRWREDTGDDLEPSEIRLSGPRIEASTGRPSIVALWSERARYGNKATGYHGGVAPQEVVVPYGAFTAGLGDLATWQPSPEPRPTWWRGQPATRPAPPLPPPARRSKEPDSPQQSLFDPPAATIEWISKLLRSPALAEQRELAGRTAPANAIIEGTLLALDARDDRISERVLAQVLEQQELRMRGILAGLQRVLNVEGYTVLEVEDQTRIIKLNRDLLKQQFDLDD